jgi:hypothetical protein
VYLWSILCACTKITVVMLSQAEVRPFFTPPPQAPFIGCERECDTFRCYRVRSKLTCERAECVFSAHHCLNLWGDSEETMMQNSQGAAEEGSGLFWCMSCCGNVTWNELCGPTDGFFFFFFFFSPPMFWLFDQDSKKKMLWVKIETDAQYLAVLFISLYM